MICELLDHMSWLWLDSVELISKTVGETEAVAADRHAFFIVSIPVLQPISISKSLRENISQRTSGLI